MVMLWLWWIAKLLLGGFVAFCILWGAYDAVIRGAPFKRPTSMPRLVQLVDTLALLGFLCWMVLVLLRDVVK